ncbi:CD276 antigen [Liparis tanakae]|uniref:CD276 antigen n=1 Tax=Liparis tanakae TaxID=230148 RepID=A0A4Z2G6T6_9TELE|nr:CD276 antigen [Liparis tanakae]
MNMASLCILLVILISIGNAKTERFMSLDCKAEQLGQYGQQSLLECVIKKTQSDTMVRMVSWKKPNLTLLVFYKGKIIEKKDGFSFAQPSWNDRNMNVSLLIANTTVKDVGQYTCDVMTTAGNNVEAISFKVTAKYSNPTIVSSPKAFAPKTDGTLTCESNGGYPKGQLRWFDEDNKELTSDAPTEAKQTDGGLFQLSSRLVVGKESSVSKYICGVFNASGGREEETPFHVQYAPKTEEQEQRKEVDTATRIVAPVVVIGSLIAGLLLALLIYRKRSQQIRRPSTAPLMGGHLEVSTEEGDDKYPDNVA